MEKICSLNLDFIKIVGKSFIIFLAFCYQFQSHSACHTTGLWIWKMRCWGNEYDFIWRAWKDGRLMSQSNHLVRAGSLWRQERERSNEELKSKGRIQRERQWGNKIKKCLKSSKTSPRRVSSCKGSIILAIHYGWGQIVSLWLDCLQSSRGAGSSETGHYILL